MEYRNRTTHFGIYRLISISFSFRLTDEVCLLIRSRKGWEKERKRKNKPNIKRWFPGVEMSLSWYIKTIEHNMRPDVKIELNFALFEQIVDLRNTPVNKCELFCLCFDLNWVWDCVGVVIAIFSTTTTTTQTMIK